MPQIIYVPIEPFEQRYTTQWWNWFPKEFKSHNIAYTFLGTGRSLSDKIRYGSFLDVISTNFYKATQLQSLCIMFEQGEIAHGDVVFFGDLWFPGLEMLAYIRDGLGIDFKIAGCLHAGTYDLHDFLHQRGMERWGKFLEMSWLEIVDYIFVATNFHKELFFKYRIGQLPTNYHQPLLGKIHVTGWPIYPEFVQPQEKSNIVVFPHRLDPEKQPDMFDRIVAELKSRFPNWQFVKTMENFRSKAEYYHWLNTSKISVSCALQETFGIAMAESLLCDAIPLVPNRLSYPELYHESFIYETESELLFMLGDLMEQIEDRQVNDYPAKLYSVLSHNAMSIAAQGRRAIYKMCQAMGMAT